jgi:pSer/pThr/pTyr-binding forkhead associated (FHA) protein
MCRCSRMVPMMSPHLVALTDGPDIPLSKPIILIGRHQECDIQIPSRKISRRHCCLAQVEKYLVVRDLGSTNGIRINGTRTLEGRLNAGDELTIGNMRYQVRFVENGVAPLAPVRAEKIVEPVEDLSPDLIGSSEQPIALPDAGREPPLRALPVPTPDQGLPEFSDAIEMIPLDSSKYT